MSRRREGSGGMVLITITVMTATTMLFAMTLHAGLRRLQLATPSDSTGWLSGFQTAEVLAAIDENRRPAQLPAASAWSPWHSDGLISAPALERMPQAAGSVMSQLQELLRLWGESTYPLQPGALI